MRFSTNFMVKKKYVYASESQFHFL